MYIKTMLLLYNINIFTSIYIGLSIHRIKMNLVIILGREKYKNPTPSYIIGMIPYRCKNSLTMKCIKVTNTECTTETTKQVQT